MQKQVFIPRLSLKTFTYCINIEILFTKKYFNLHRSNKGGIISYRFYFIVVKKAFKFKFVTFRFITPI